MVKQNKIGGWKGLPSWVKGGILGLILAVIFSLYAFFSFQCVGLSEDGTSSCPTGLDLYLWSLKESYLPILITLVSLFLIGSLIGLVFGKIKSRKMKK